MSDKDEKNATTQYLTFVLDEEIYAIPIVNVREVLQFDTVTKVPQTPDFMRGIINLRGSVVPVVDMRSKFGMGRIEKSVSTSVVVIEVEVDGETTMLGAMADSVQEVIDLEESDITAPPRIGTRLNIDFIQGMGKKEERFIIILNLEKIFTVDELSIVQIASELTPDPDTVAA